MSDQDYQVVLENFPYDKYTRIMKWLDTNGIVLVPDVFLSHFSWAPNFGPGTYFIREVFAFDNKTDAIKFKLTFNGKS